MLASSKFVPLLLPAILLPGCVTKAVDSRKANQWIIAFWTFPLLFNTVIMILTFLRVRYYKRLTRIIPILKTFLADAGFYYLVIVGVNLVNVCFYFTNNPYHGLNSAGALVLTSLMVSRSLYNTIHLFEEYSGN